MPDPTAGELLARLVSAARDAGIFLGILLAVYLPGRLVVVPLLERIEDVVPVAETHWNPFVKVVNALFALFALYLAIPLSGLATTPTTIAALSAAATLAIGFASRDVLNNLVSGVFIVVDPEFHIGDWIVWKDKEGIIEDISFRVTRVHTFDNELISVPNAELAANAVINPAAKDTVRITQELPISYEDGIDEVEAIVVDIARDSEEILDRPRATVRVEELGDDAIVVVARFWVADPARADILRIRSSFIRTVIDRFEAADIEMPYPHRVLSGRVEATASSDLPE